MALQTDEAARGRPRFHLRVEDVALFAWLVLRPILTPPGSDLGAASGFDPLGGLFDLVGLCAAAAAIAARRADGTHRGLVAQGDVQWVVGPLFGAVAFALSDCVGRLGLTGGLETVPLTLPIATAIAARIWLPPTTAPVRRALLTPFILATSGFFGDIVGRIGTFFDLRQLGRFIGGDTTGIAAFATILALLGVLVFYLMLVYAPRQLADREGTPLNWAVRFLVFVAGLAMGTTLAPIVHGIFGRAT